MYLGSVYSALLLKENIMSDSQYIVLRARDNFVPTFDNLGASRGSAGVPPAAGPVEEIEISEVSLSKREMGDLRRDPNTMAIAPPMPLKLIEPQLSADSNAADTGSTTWGVEAVAAQASSYDGSGVSVAVLDTGIDLSHPAFAGAAITRKNFTTEGEDDIHGHGTHCAGTIFGQDVNGVRIGVARGVSHALIGKVLGEGQGSSATLANAINWAVENGANVISMSLGIDFPGFVDFLVNQQGMDINPATSIALEAYRSNINLYSALTTMLQARNPYAHGAVIVAASGNESNRPQYEIAVAPPAAGNGVISVGALQQGSSGLSVASFSNTQCNVSAPGVAISSAALGGGLVSWNGTSMATPHVAGIAALWAQKELQESGRITTQNMTARILAMATRSGMAPGAELEDIGNGIVQAP
jgi:subtilisin family serine protease